MGGRWSTYGWRSIDGGGCEIMARDVRPSTSSCDVGSGMEEGYRKTNLMTMMLPVSSGSIRAIMDGVGTCGEHIWRRILGGSSHGVRWTPDKHNEARFGN